jgi:hypothetical protein
MPGIRLHPNYHGYKLDDRDLRGCCLPLIVTWSSNSCWLMEDERMMHPLLRVERWKPRRSSRWSSRYQATVAASERVRKLRGQPLRELVEAGEVFVEISTLEGVGGVSNILTQVPTNRVPLWFALTLFYFESALFKLRESP